MYRWKWKGPERTLRIDSWVNERLARHDWLQVKAFGWFFRMAHWLGWHHASVYSPDDSSVQGITFGTEEYVNQVVEAHEAMFGQAEEQDDG